MPRYCTEIPPKVHLELCHLLGQNSAWKDLGRPCYLCHCHIQKFLTSVYCATFPGHHEVMLFELLHLCIKQVVNFIFPALYDL